MNLNRWLALAGWLTLLAAVLHLAIPVGGPDWYRFFGAPERLVQMAAAGRWYPVLFCLFVALILGIAALYAFSGAGMVRRLPLRTFVLGAFGALFLLRGLTFIPLAIFKPGMLARFCDCQGVDMFLVVTSLVSLVIGIGFAGGCWMKWKEGGR
jgi:hypothetical protein